MSQPRWRKNDLNQESYLAVLIGLVLTGEEKSPPLRP
jgi:hypothetical protein